MSRKRKIDDQQSERDIINVAGNLNLNGGTLQVEKLFVGDQDQLDGKIQEAEQQTLSLQFSISYFEVVRKNFAGKPLLERALLEDLWQQVN